MFKNLKVQIADTIVNLSLTIPQENGISND